MCATRLQVLQLAVDVEAVGGLHRSARRACAAALAEPALAQAPRAPRRVLKRTAQSPHRWRDKASGLRCAVRFAPTTQRNALIQAEFNAVS
jgi:hypothetical protein